MAQVAARKSVGPATAAAAAEDLMIRFLLPAVGAHSDEQISTEACVVSDQPWCWQTASGPPSILGGL